MEFIQLGNHNIKVSNIKEFGIGREPHVIYQEYEKKDVYQKKTGVFGNEKNVCIGYEYGKLLIEKDLGIDVFGIRKGKGIFSASNSQKNLIIDNQIIDEHNCNFGHDYTVEIAKKKYQFKDTIDHFADKNNYVEYIFAKYIPGYWDKPYYGSIITSEDSLRLAGGYLCKFKQVVKKYLYVTTYQNNNYQFHEKDFNIDKLHEQIKAACATRTNKANVIVNSQDDFQEKVAKLKMMRDANLLSDQEFEKEKKKLLNSL